MKIAAILLLLMALVLNAYGQLFEEIDPKLVPTLMSSPKTVQNHVDCLLLPEDKAAIQCSRTGKLLRRNFHAGFIKPGCPSACNEQEKLYLAFIYRNLKKRYPEHYQLAIDHYKITPEQIKTLEAWVATIPEVPEVTK